MSKTSLEARISAAWANTNCSAATLAELLAETDIAIIEKEKNLAWLRTEVFDFSKYPDRKAARQQLEDAEFELGSLQTFRPKLAQHLAAAEAAEQHDAWISAFEEHKPRVDALAERFRAEYPAAVKTLVDLFTEMAALDARSSGIAGMAPAGEPRRTRGVEETARDLANGGFGGATPSIVRNVVLPSWEHSDETAWPIKPPPPDASFYNLMNGQRSHPTQFTAEWWVASAEQNERDRITQVQAEKDEKVAFERFWGRA